MKVTELKSNICAYIRRKTLQIISRKYMRGYTDNNKQQLQYGKFGLTHGWIDYIKIETETQVRIDTVERFLPAPAPTSRASTNLWQNFGYVHPMTPKYLKTCLLQTNKNYNNHRM